LEGARNRLVPLSREVEMAHAFVAVQLARFGPTLRFHLELDEAAAAVLVPPLLLQPVIENALLHGVANRRGGGRVEVRISRAGEQVILAVQDDGPGPGASPHRGSGTSLRELRERLALVYGDAAQLSTSTGDAGGFTARISIPARGLVP